MFKSLGGVTQDSHTHAQLTQLCAHTQHGLSSSSMDSIGSSKDSKNQDTDSKRDRTKDKLRNSLSQTKVCHTLPYVSIEANIPSVALRTLSLESMEKISKTY